MLTAVALIVGAIMAWLVVDHLLITMKERRERAGDAWHGRGPGTTFHSTGFEDTLPPHEAMDRSGRRAAVRT
jgi:hypothetical protein